MCITFISTILEMDKENLNGRIYNKKSVNQLISSFQEKKEFYDILGESFYEIKPYEDRGYLYNIYSGRMSHNVHNIYIEDNKLKCEIEILNTISGLNILNYLTSIAGLGTYDENKQYKDLDILFNNKFAVIPRCIGTADKNKIANIKELITFDIILKEDSSFN